MRLTLNAKYNYKLDTQKNEQAPFSQINHWLDGGHTVVITQDRLNEYATHNYWKYLKHKNQFRIEISKGDTK